MPVTLETPAFILRSIAHGESDRIVTLFTLARGKLAAIALGARRSRKRFGGGLEPFALLRVRLTMRPSSELARLEGAEVVQPNSALSRDLVRMGEGALALELCRELCPTDQPEPRLFEGLSRVLAELAAGVGAAAASSIGGDLRPPPRPPARSGGASPPPLAHDSPRSSSTSTVWLVAFQLLALEVAGLYPRLSECGVCGRPVPAGRSVRFDPARGGVVCRADGGGPITLSGRTLAGLLAIGSGRPDSLSATDARAASEALRALAEWHLGRPLESGAFLAQITPRASPGGSPSSK